MCASAHALMPRITLWREEERVHEHLHFPYGRRPQPERTRLDRDQPLSGLAATLQFVVLREFLPREISDRSRHEVGDGNGEIVLEPDHRQPRSMEDAIEFLIDGV